MKNFWNTLKAKWYREGLKYSEFPDRALSIILPLTKDCKTFLDVGSGCGTLSLPLAENGKKVTALDPSHAMIEILKEEIQIRKIKGIECIETEWGKKKIKPHDAVICANVPPLLKGAEDFIKDAERLAKKAVFLIEGADPNADRFYYKELYPLLFNKEFLPRNDYLSTYNTLHRLGIYANVEIIEYNFDQPFTDINEAVEFWKEYIPLVTEEFDSKLKGFLEKKLVETKDGLMAKFSKKSALMWWRKP